MLNQKTLEELVSEFASNQDIKELLNQLASNQNNKTTDKAEVGLGLLTAKNMKQVLGSLLDPASFYTQHVSTREVFAERLKAAYQGMQKDNVPAHFDALRGAIGLICFTLELLIETSRQEQASSLSKFEWPQELLSDPAVQNWFYEVYKPSTRRNDSTSQGNSTKNKNKGHLDPPRSHWQELDLNSLKLYRVGTTSFILNCQVNILGGKQLVLKCLLFPYTRVAPIAEATNRYALQFNSAKVSMTAQVYSSTDKWILMDFIDGPTLKEILDDCRELEKKAQLLLRTGLLASIGQRLLETLSTLPYDIQHLDLTPSNIIVVKKSVKTLHEAVSEPDEYIKELNESIERIVLIDFGRNYLYTRKVGLSENRETLFVAPEVKDDRSTDHTSDLYSFGMILTELADPKGAQNATIPDSIYQYAPTLARFIEDLVDADPKNRLDLFGSQEDPRVFSSQTEKEEIYTNLRRVFMVELSALSLAQEEESEEELDVDPWVQPIWKRVQPIWVQIRPIWKRVQPIKNLFVPPDDQLARQRKLWRLTRSSKRPEIARYSGWLYRWLVYCTIHWNLCLAICFLWGMRDIGVGAFPAFVNVIQVKIFHCDSCIPGIDSLRAASYHISNNLADISANLPARLAIFSVWAQTKNYQNILAGLTARSLSGKLARATEFTLRGSAICSLIPVTIGNLYQPRWWLILLVVGYTTVCLNNFLLYRLACEQLEKAKEAGLSTVPRSDVPALEAFGTWGPNMVAYMVLLLVIGIGLQIGFLHDEWIYVIGTVGVSILVLGVSRCIRLAPSLRGSLNRAFIIGERCEAISRRIVKK